MIDLRRHLSRFILEIPESYPNASAKIRNADLKRVISLLRDIHHPYARELLSRLTRGRVRAVDLYHMLRDLRRTLDADIRGVPRSGRGLIASETSTLRRQVAELEERVLELADKEKADLVDKEIEDEEAADFASKAKQFKAADKRVFVIMPFAPEFDDVWHGAIERACHESKFVPLRVDEISLSKVITDDMKECIGLAQTVIADITGSNPNVMFELGWAMANGRALVVIRQAGDEQRVPFDVYGIRRIEYADSWSGVEKLRQDIKRFLQETTADKGAQKAAKKQKPVGHAQNR